MCTFGLYSFIPQKGRHRSSEVQSLFFGFYGPRTMSLTPFHGSNSAAVPQLCPSALSPSVPSSMEKDLPLNLSSS